MNITILGKHGFGKSNLGDIVRGTIFKMDDDATIKNNDADRLTDAQGSGSRIHNVNVRAVENGESMAALAEEFAEEDIIVIVNNEKFYEWLGVINS